MVQGLQAAINELKRHPGRAVTAKIDDLVIEMRVREKEVEDDFPAHELLGSVTILGDVVEPTTAPEDLSLEAETLR